MFEFHHAKLPSILNSFFTRNDVVHDYSTRQHSKLHVPLCKTYLASTCVRNTGVTIYNHFYDLISLNSSYCSYRKKSEELFG